MANKPLNAAGIVGLLGGRTILWRRLQAANIPLSIKSIEKWTERGSIPAKRLSQLVSLARGLGITLNINEFLNTETNRPQTDNERI